MKGMILWVVAIAGGAAAGAAGGAAWLAYAAPEAVEEASAVGEEDAADVPDGSTSPLEVQDETPSVTSDDGPTVSEPGAIEASVDEPVSESAGPTTPAGTTREAAATAGTGSGELTASAPATGPDPEPFEPTESHQRLARIFAAMRPAEAAAVLGQLDDEQARGVLVAMPARSAAPILAELDPGRAASLSRLVLGQAAP